MLLGHWLWHALLESGFFGPLLEREKLTLGYCLWSISLGPALEELLFRRLIFAYGRKYSSFWPGALLSSLLFALAHREPMSSLAEMLLLGLALCHIFEISGSLWESIGCHAGHNLLFLLLLQCG
jgi:membrane protease YdiL (CAAX protease family)